MKKSLLALAALTAFAGVASAQSSVTLFGVVDLEARNVKNSGSTAVKSLSTDGYNSSRLGFRGIEDLGGGMRAGFWIESGLAADAGGIGGSNGIATVHFNRRATLSLMGGFGELRLGRDYTPSFWNHTVFDPFGTNGLGSTLNITSLSLGSPAITGVRDNNTIGYFLPAMGGLYGQVMVAAQEGTMGQGYKGFRLGYAAGPVNVAIAMGKTKKTFTMLDTFDDTNFGMSFNLGFMTLMAQYGKTDYARENQKTMMFGGHVPVGSGTIRFSYTSNTGSTATAALANQYKAKQMALGYVHDLSKRTALYTTYARVSNGGTSTNGANFTVGGPGGTQTRGASSTGYEFGVRHSF